jgi:hypothetical protein
LCLKPNIGGKMIAIIKKLSITLFLTSIFSSSFISADSSKEVEQFPPVEVIANNSGYMILSNQSYWKVIAFSARSQSWSEWWNSTKLVPETYECSPSEWTLGTTIEVYSKSCDLEIDDTNAANKSALRKCSHLFFNPETGTILFAIPLEAEELLTELYNKAYEFGCVKGMTLGNAACLR